MDGPKYNDLNARSVIKVGEKYIPMYAHSFANYNLICLIRTRA